MSHVEAQTNTPPQSDNATSNASLKVTATEQSAKFPNDEPSLVTTKNDFTAAREVTKHLAAAVQQHVTPLSHLAEQQTAADAPRIAVPGGADSVRRLLTLMHVGSRPGEGTMAPRVPMAPFPHSRALQKPPLVLASQEMIMNTSADTHAPRVTHEATQDGLHTPSPSDRLWHLLVVTRGEEQELHPNESS